MTDDEQPFANLVDRHGPAKQSDRSVAHARPDGISDATIEALGALSAALETAEHARGHLYAFHRLSGSTDREIQEAVAKLRDAGRSDIADVVAEVMIGRDVIAGMWSFQLIERYDAEYWSAFRDVERAARAAAGNAEPHTFEAEMKHAEQS
jgi:hypothetical protein